MFLERILSHGKKERYVIEDIRRHIELLRAACDVFKMSLEKRNRDLMWEVVELEREADSVRRQVISHIYEGAFLPYLRPDLCKFVEIVDEVFDFLKETAFYCVENEVPEPLRDESIRVALLNFRMCDMLMSSFEAMLRGEDLREKTLAVRIFEKKIDDIKHNLMKEAEEVRIDNFWAGKSLSDFITNLTMISDIIEDASDHLQIINVSTR
jgi:uncharacterized protein